MAAARDSAPFSVLKGCVDVQELTGDPGQAWTRIECASKKAYGCGERGQEVVEGLKLYVRRGDDPVLSSSLAIRMSDEAHRSIDAEIGVHPKDRLRWREVYAGSSIQIADQHLIVIMLVFRREYRRNLVYYLVYDNIDASLSMIKYLPDHLEAASQAIAVPERTADGSGYELVLMAHELRPRNDVLCLCTPETRGANPASDGTGPWQVKERRFPGRIPGYFSADVAFSCQGKVFWADLSLGLVHCNLHTSGSVDFDFIELPPGYRKEMPRDEPKKMSRTMGCVGDYIWFVCIEPMTGGYQHYLVTMWTLDLTEEQWTKEVEFSAESLLSLDSFKEAGLPDAPLMFPVMTADGALCIVLSDPQDTLDDDIYTPIEYFICSFDVRRKRLLWHGRVGDHYWPESVILPSNFFRSLYLPHKRKLAEAAGLTLAGSQVVLLPHRFI